MNVAALQNIFGRLCLIFAQVRSEEINRMPSGIKDKVAILGMGCARFGERWNDDADTLMVEAFDEAMLDAGIDVTQIDAAWLGVGFDAQNIGPSGIPLSMALRLPNIGVTKVDNYCASGAD